MGRAGSDRAQLDIINCAALAVAEDHAIRNRKRQRKNAGLPGLAALLGARKPLAWRKPLEQVAAGFAPTRALARRLARV